MTRAEALALAREKWGEDGWYFDHNWRSDPDRATHVMLSVKQPSGDRIVYEGASWEDTCRAAGLIQ